MNSSRIEERIKQILEESAQVQKPNSRIEEILKCIFDGSTYTQLGNSKIEEGLIKILQDSGDPIKNPSSRIEYLINGIIQNDELSSYISRSRIEELLKKWNFTPDQPSGVEKYISFSSSPYTLQNTVYGEIKLQTLYGKSFHNIEPTFQQPQNFYSAGEENGFVYLTNGTNTSKLFLDGGLSGIPNAENNVTYYDDSNIPWYSDFIDLVSGKLVKQTKTISIDASLDWYDQPNIAEYKAVYFTANKLNNIAPFNQLTTWESTISNIGIGDARSYINVPSVSDYIAGLDSPLVMRGRINNGHLRIAFPWKFGIKNYDSLFSFLEETDAKVLLPIDQVQRDLTSEELNTLIKIYTQNGSTTISHNLGKIGVTYMSKS